MEDYEEWKARMIAMAKAQLNNCEKVCSIDEKENILIGS